MIEVSLSKAVKNFGFKKILDDFNFEVNTNEKVALIGPNGTGKSTILKIINKEEELDEGILSIRKGATIGYLPQIPPILEGFTVKKVLTRGFENLEKLEEKLKSLELKMSNEQDSQKLEKLCTTYCNVQQKYESLGGYEKNTKLKKICAGFKIKDEMLERQFNSLSGGEKTICYLASLMVASPSILILDEPTNHLDIETLEWFEEYLKNYNGTVIIVSHDRYFLDRVVNKIILVENGKAEYFYGNYSYYLEENEKRLMIEFENYKNQQKMIEAMKNKIKRLQEFGRLAGQSGGEMFFKRAASIQKRLDKIEVLNKPEDKKELPLDFQIEKRSGNDVLTTNKFSLTIGDRPLIEKANLDIHYQERVALMGKNGSGKSTFIKYLLGLNDRVSTEGILKVGSNVKFGYIPQEINFEDPHKTVLQIARESFIGDETHLRASLAKFLFCGDNVFKQASKLSGGEKVRLKLFELIQKKANFLILDEPTNHIDISTREMLEEALLEYDGTLLFISHDRYFINRLANRIIFIENKTFKSYVGNYDYYKECIKKGISK